MTFTANIVSTDSDSKLLDNVCLITALQLLRAQKFHFIWALKIRDLQSHLVPQLIPRLYSF